MGRSCRGREGWCGGGSAPAGDGRTQTCRGLHLPGVRLFPTTSSSPSRSGGDGQLDLGAAGDTVEGGRSQWLITVVDHGV